MFSILSLFVNWYMLAFVLVLAAGALLIYFTQGPAKLLEDVCDWHTWVIVGLVATGITLYNSSQTIKQQQQTIQTTQTNDAAGKDGLATVTNNVTKKKTRTEQAAKQQNIIDAAPEGDAMDALMDDVANELSKTKPGK